MSVTRFTPMQEGVHPGELLRAALAERDLSQATLAELIGRPATMLNEMINGKRTITAYTALELEKVLGIEPEYWLHAQADYDLAQARARLAAGKRRPYAR